MLTPQTATLHHPWQQKAIALLVYICFTTVTLANGPALATSQSNTQPLTALTHNQPLLPLPSFLATRLATAKSPLPTAPQTLAEDLQTLHGTLLQLRDLLANTLRAPDTPQAITDRRTQVEALQQRIRFAENHLQAYFQAQRAQLDQAGLGGTLLARQDQAEQLYQQRRQQLSEQLEVLRRSSAADLPEAVTQALATLGHYAQARAQVPLDRDTLPTALHTNTAKAPRIDPALLPRPTVPARRIGEAPPPTSPTPPPRPATKTAHLPTLPVPEDFAISQEVTRTPAIQALADKLNHDPLQIYTWVRNHIDVWPGQGIAQNADLTLARQRGNPYDVAALSIALLRASGIAARFQTATIQVRMDWAQNWLGMDDPARVLRYLAQARMPSVGVVEGGRIIAVQLETVYVRAYIDYLPGNGALHRKGHEDTWVELPIIEAKYETTPGQLTTIPTRPLDLTENALASGQFDATEGWFSGIDPRILEQGLADYQAQIAALVGDPDPRTDDLLGHRKIAPVRYPVLFPSSPHRILDYRNHYAQLPDTLRQYTAIKLYTTRLDRTLGRSSLHARLSFAELGQHRLALHYRPAEDVDAELLASYSGQAQFAPYLIQVIPVLTLDGLALARGAPVQMGSPQYLDVVFATPYETTTIPHTLTAGDETVLGLNTTGIHPADIRARLAQTPTDSSTEQLHQLSLHYWMEHDFINELLARSLGVQQFRMPSVGLFSSPLTVQDLFGIPALGRYQSRRIDVRRELAAAVAPEPDTLKRFLIGTGILGSYLESAVPEQLFGHPSGSGISAAELLYEANAQGIPIHILTPDKQSALSELNVSGNVYQAITHALAQGLWVIVPRERQQHGTWQGSGYILLDPTHGSGAYQIEGGYAGGETPDPCQSGTSPLYAIALNLAIEATVEFFIERGMQWVSAFLMSAGGLPLVIAFQMSVMILVQTFLIDLLLGWIPLPRGTPQNCNDCLGKAEGSACTLASNANLPCSTGKCKKNRCQHVPGKRKKCKNKCPAGGLGGSGGGPGGNYPSAPPLLGNPVHAATGNKYQRESLYQGSGPLPLQWEWIYNSDNTPAWRHSYQAHIAHTWQGNSPPTDLLAAVHRPNGSIYLYTNTYDTSTNTIASLQWTGDPDVADTLYTRLDPNTGTAIGFQYHALDDTIEEYDFDGQLQQRSDRAGRSQRLTRNHDTTTVTDPYGRTLRYTQNTAAHTLSLTLPGQEQYRFRFDPNGNLQQIRYPDATPSDDNDNPTRNYHYEDARHPHALTRIIDPRQHTIGRYQYDEQGRVTQSEGAAGTNRYQFEYLSDTRTRVTDPLGAIRSYHFTEKHGSYLAIKIEGGPCTACGGSGLAHASYDANGHPASITDFENNTTTYQYNARGLQESRTEAANTPQARTLTTTWHPDYRRASQIKTPGQTTTIEYNTQANPIYQTQQDRYTGETRTTSYTYTAEGLQETADGPRTDLSDQTRYAYQNGIRTRTTNPLQQTTKTLTLDAHGRAHKTQDANGRLTTLNYDPQGRLIQQTTGNETTTFAYDLSGNLKRLTLPSGETLSYHYDAANRLQQIQDGLGNRTEYTLDPIGNRKQARTYDAHGTLRASQRWRYDSNNHLIAEIGGEGQTTNYAYDQNGNPIRQTDPKQSQLPPQNQAHYHYEYDPLQRLRLLKDPANGITRYAYTDQDDLARVTDPNNATTTYIYNGYSELTQQQSPDTGTTTHGYDPAGNLKTSQDARGVLVQKDYDALNRLKAVHYPDPSYDILLFYDQGENAKGYLSKIKDPSGYTEYSYDAQGRQQHISQHQDGHSFTLSYSYEPGGQLQSLTYPSGQIITYSYDAAGNIQTVQQKNSNSSNPPQLLAENITYLPFGGLQSLQYGNGLTLHTRHDQDLRLRTLTIPGILERRYTPDANDNLLTIEDLKTPAANQSFGYDLLDRLIQAQGSYGKQSYRYDLVGNRKTKTTTAGAEAYHYTPQSNRLENIQGVTLRTFQYDANGNTTEDGRFSYTYGQNNRLAAVHDLAGNLVAKYQYNADGERVKKTADGQTTYFIYGQAGELLAEMAADGGVQREYVYLYSGSNTSLDSLAAQHPLTLGGKDRGFIQDFEHFALLEKKQTHFYHNDHLGTPQVLTDASGSVVWEGRFHPFGVVDVIANEMENGLRFPGQLLDKNTGLLTYIPRVWSCFCLIMLQ